MLGPNRFFGPPMITCRKAQTDFSRFRPGIAVSLEPVYFVEHLAPALGLVGLLSGNVATDEVFRFGDLFLLPLPRGV